MLLSRLVIADYVLRELVHGYYDISTRKVLELEHLDFGPAYYAKSVQMSFISANITLFSFD